MTTLLIDVSVAQGHIDWVRVARWVGPNGERVEGAIVKATQGNTGEDPQCAANSSGASAVDLLCGWYAFADPDTLTANDPEIEALHLVTVAKRCGFTPGKHFLMLDIEQARKIHAGPAFADWVLRWCRTALAETGVTPVIYSGGPFLNAETAGAPADTLVELARFPFIIAAYVPAGSLRRFMPATWADWFLWQESGDQAASDCTLLHVDGIGGGHVNVDRDVFRGSIDDLHAFIARLVATPTDPAPAPDGASAHGLAIDHLRDVEDEASLADTIPETPTGKSAPRMAAVDAPIAGVDDTWPGGGKP